MNQHSMVQRSLRSLHKGAAEGSSRARKSWDHCKRRISWGYLHLSPLASERFYIFYIYKSLALPWENMENAQIPKMIVIEVPFFGSRSEWVHKTQAAQAAPPGSPCKK